MFVTYLKENGFICHGTNELRWKARKVYCKKCHRCILDVEKHLTVDTLPMLSCYVAKLYAEWTGDVYVPCRIPIKNIPGIEPRLVVISYCHLLNVIQLLGTVNQKFIHCNNRLFKMSETVKQRILETFLDSYVTLVENVQCETTDDSVETIVKNILHQLKNVFNTQEYNIFDYFEKIICPYVKMLDSGIEIEDYHEESIGEFFLHLSLNATKIRQRYAKYCLSFDIIYVMIYCFACHTDVEVVANFVFDLTARICSSYFEGGQLFQQTCLRLLQANISHHKNTALYYVVKNIQKGQAADVFSMDFYNKYVLLQQLMYNEFVKVTSSPSEMVTRFAFSQSFPYILFPCVSKYYAFMCSMGYASGNWNEKTGFEKGTCATARQIMHFVEQFSQEIEQFGQSQVEFWTLDVFKLFIGRDENVLKHLIQFLALLHKRNGGDF